MEVWVTGIGAFPGEAAVWILAGMGDVKGVLPAVGVKSDSEVDGTV